MIASGAVRISPEDLFLVKTKLSQLQSQFKQSLTMAAAIQQYETLIQKKHAINLPHHAFWIANSVVDPDTNAALEYRNLKLGSQAK